MILSLSLSLSHLSNGDNAYLSTVCSTKVLQNIIIVLKAIADPFLPFFSPRLPFLQCFLPMEGLIREVQLPCRVCHDALIEQATHWNWRAQGHQAGIAEPRETLK